MFRGELVNPHELRLEKDIEYHEYVRRFFSQLLYLAKKRKSNEDVTRY